MIPAKVLVYPVDIAGQDRTTWPTKSQRKRIAHLVPMEYVKYVIAKVLAINFLLVIIAW